MVVVEAVAAWARGGKDQEQGVTNGLTARGAIVAAAAASEAAEVTQMTITSTSVSERVPTILSSWNATHNAALSFARSRRMSPIEI